MKMSKRYNDFYIYYINTQNLSIDVIAGFFQEYGTFTEKELFSCDLNSHNLLPTESIFYHLLWSEHKDCLPYILNMSGIKLGMDRVGEIENHINQFHDVIHYKFLNEIC